MSDIDRNKFKHLDRIVNKLMDDLLKLDLTSLETQYVLNEMFRFNFRITNSKINKIRKDRIKELENIAQDFMSRED